MASSSMAVPGPARKPIRLWPGLVIASLVLVVRFLLPLVTSDAALYAVLGGAAGGAAILLWWLLLSRAPWKERLGAVLLMIVAVAATSLIVHPSIRGGLMGMLLVVFLAVPGLGLALVVWAAATRGLPDRTRFAALIAIVLATCALFASLRTDGIKGGVPDMSWRWTPTAEERLLARSADLPTATTGTSPTQPVTPAPTEPAATSTASPSTPSVAKATNTVTSETVKASAATDPEIRPAAWTGFRGPARDGRAPGTRIETDWSKSPPVEMWRRPVGPGWSSFAVRGDIFYTQEQRGDDELVVAYKVSTGEPVWRHSDPVRFYESNGGAGPRGTPTIEGDRVYALGATGILNVLDAARGAVAWTRNAASDTGVKLPGWGFTSSPLIVDDLVVVATSGALIAYDRHKGEGRWKVASPGGSYSSPQLATLDGVRQILMLAGSGVRSLSPVDGKVLWENEWKGIPIVQPAVIGNRDVLITSADAMGGFGVRRLSVTQQEGVWKVEERWTSRGLKPYFNDYVINDDHAYGFDGRILSCISLQDGSRKWKGGRYGEGQMLLLPDQDILLVLSEDGELALVSATPGEFKELARIPVLNAKTWNHPVLVGDVLLLRNGEEMVALRLTRASR